LIELPNAALRLSYARTVPASSASSNCNDTGAVYVIPGSLPKKYDKTAHRDMDATTTHASIHESIDGTVRKPRTLNLGFALPTEQ
jgi:hypothetical protein